MAARRNLFVPIALLFAVAPCAACGGGCPSAGDAGADGASDADVDSDAGADAGADTDAEIEPVACADDAPCAPLGLICNEEWGICAVADCAGRDDFTPCELDTSTKEILDRSYDICVDGACVSPGCGAAACNAPSPHFPLPDTGQRACYDGKD